MVWLLIPELRQFFIIVYHLSKLGLSCFQVTYVNARIYDALDSDFLAHFLNTFNYLCNCFVLRCHVSSFNSSFALCDFYFGDQLIVRKVVLRRVVDVFSKFVVSYDFLLGIYDLLGWSCQAISPFCGVKIDTFPLNLVIYAHLDVVFNFLTFKHHIHTICY